MDVHIPNTHRFFVAPEALTGDEVLIHDGDLARQVGRVLRLRPGALLLLLDGEGGACAVRLAEVGRDHVAGQVEQRGLASGEPLLKLALYVALIRAERFEWLLQKGTELGVSSFVPVVFARSLMRDHPADNKLHRWQRIVREAAEQSCRALLPTIAPPQNFADACARAAAAGPAFILWEGHSAPAAPSLRAALRAAWETTPPPTLALLSGPEGGIAPEELTIAREHGIMPVSLGPRILRAETAPVAAAAAIFYEVEG
jgi:16S rRNA (uracil1498-N3)-methyltransferase